MMPIDTPQTTVPLLELVTTGTPERASVRAFCDAMLWAREPGSATARIYALSLVGPEQTIKAIGAGCWQEDGRRTELNIGGPTRKVKGTWAWTWQHQTRALCPGTFHCIAYATSSRGVKRMKSVQRLILPDEHGRIDTRLYDILLEEYSTPLIAAGAPGQPEWEAAAGREWRREITKRLLHSKHFTALSPHPEQAERSWDGAGVLSLEQAELDKLVSMMLRDRTLVIPRPQAA